MNFYQLNELLVQQQRARKSLEKHPLYATAKFGMELEFKILGDPDNGMVVDNQGEDQADARMFEQKPLYYWKNHFTKLLADNYYKVSWGAEATEEKWGIGPDGHAEEYTEDGNAYEVPIIELRSPPLAVEESNLRQMAKFLSEVHSSLISNRKHLIADGGTGLHIHVSHAAMNKGKYITDSFTKLAAWVGVDEGQIWDDMTRYDRQFDRHASLNRPDQYDYGAKGVHHYVIQIIKDKIGGSGKKAGTIYFPDEQLESIAAHLPLMAAGRAAGVNVRSRKPTIEYRYLCSAMLEAPIGPSKVIDYIKYFAQHSVSVANKNRFVIDTGEERAVFTRVPEGARVDYQMAEFHGQDDKTYQHVPQSGYKITDLRANRALRSVSPFPKPKDPLSDPRWNSARAEE